MTLGLCISQPPSAITTGPKMSLKDRHCRISQRGGSDIIHHFTTKSPVFMPLGARRLKKCILVTPVIVCIAISFLACGGSSKKSTTRKASGLPERVLVSQSVTSTAALGGLFIINGSNDTLPAGVTPLSAGTNPGLMAISPTRNVAAAVDSASDTVYAVDTTTES